MKNLIINVVKPLYRFVKNKNEREFYRLHDKWGGKTRYKITEGVKFLNYTVNVPDLESFIWQFKDIFLDEIFELKAGKEIPVVYDCGANIGMSCLFFKKMAPKARIKAFEPDKYISGFLKKNLLLNGFNDIEIIEKAVWINNTGVSFTSDGADGGSILGEENKVNLESIRLRDLLMAEENIDLLKMDIEGAEFDVILDCQDHLSRVQNIFIEYHSWNNSSQNLSKILNVLEKNNFRYYIEDLHKRKIPFVNKASNQIMDLQLNIFGYKNL